MPAAEERVLAAPEADRYHTAARFNAEDAVSAESEQSRAREEPDQSSQEYRAADQSGSEPEERRRDTAGEEDERGRWRRSLGYEAMEPAEQYDGVQLQQPKGRAGLH